MPKSISMILVQNELPNTLCCLIILFFLFGEQNLVNLFHFWIRTFSCEIYVSCWSSPRGSNSTSKGSVINDAKQTSATRTCDWGGTLGALVTGDSVPSASLRGSDRLCPLLKSLECSGCTEFCFSWGKWKKSHTLFNYIVIAMFSFSHVEKANAV